MAVLLIVLWVRSYWWAEFCERSFWSHWVKVESFSGQLVFKHHSPESVASTLHSYPTEEIASQAFMKERGLPKIELGHGLLLLPYWLPVTTFATLATLPWLLWRFTLRTLLIATTLIALVLGLIVWSAIVDMNGPALYP